MELTRDIFGIILVLALLGFLLWLSKKRAVSQGPIGGRKSGRTLELLDKVALTANHSVHLLRIGERTLAIAVHNSGLTVLCESVKTRSTEA